LSATPSHLTDGPLSVAATHIAANDPVPAGTVESGVDLDAVLTGTYPNLMTSARADAGTYAHHIGQSVTGEETDTLRPRLTVLVALMTVLRALLPTIVAVLCLDAIVTWHGETFDLRAPEVVIMAVLCLVLVHIPARVTSVFSSLGLPSTVGILGRWILLLAVLAVIEPAIRDFGTFADARTITITWAVTTPLILVLAAMLMDRVGRTLLPAATSMRKCVFVGYNEPSVMLASRLSIGTGLRLQPMGFFDDRSGDRLGLERRNELVGKLAELPDFVKRNKIDVIFISLPIRHIQRVTDLVDDLHDTTASIYYVPDVYVFNLIQARSGQIAGVPVVALLETPLSGYGAILKRIFDVGVAATMLLCLAPLLALVALAVKATSAGPAIFTQRRYGLDGSEITVYKFRTMSVTEDGPAIRQASKNDDRTTRIGAFLRRTSIDELPQLINVLQGRMSLVGPRPHAVAHNEQYRKLIKGYMLRHKVQPGITGLAQVNGARGETLRLEDMQARITYDLDYLRNWSPALDMKILLLTAVRFLRDKKAY
jgi:putative colanic acid biosysnthesis UDP-glucose lipid carrier transferase